MEVAADVYDAVKKTSHSGLSRARSMWTGYGFAVAT